MKTKLDACILYSSLFNGEVDRTAEGIQLALATQYNMPSTITNWHPALEVTDVMDCLNAKVKIIIMTELLAEQLDYVLRHPFEYQEDDEYKLKWILARYLTDKELKDPLIGIYYDGPEQYDWLPCDHLAKDRSTTEFIRLMDSVLKE
ncbi:hypothetical protein [Dolosicoccus paucivorans]|uniref:Uncharacterized protein n=1 Tax=Dolosicoccus paucivorans TaxID=84521 RepID=A0A1G8PLR8_9LACT|nr:hypothetical protein [Dolosicoccus paucivorans]PMB83921.1 hypothetical protein CJ206_06575 [Dolosicoccus paucivorans]PMC58128.1 hypothetical protein CJ205_05985 [Dolosicoccus paucivorans]SDI93322.1 hypothetical protein SAMN04487994_10772 [Dolosicoccus paucivorans]